MFNETLATVFVYLFYLGWIQLFFRVFLGLFSPIISLVKRVCLLTSQFNLVCLFLIDYAAHRQINCDVLLNCDVLRTLN